MRLSFLLNEANIPFSLPCDAEIVSITQNSKEATVGTLFACIEGFTVDGHRFATDAYQRGCRCFLAQKPLEVGADAIVIPVEDTKHALGMLADAFYGRPSRRLSVIGITGTKGKTTTALLLCKILNDNGVSCGYIGTNGILYGSKQAPLPNTTPDAITLQKYLSEMAEHGCRAVALEVSSQALMLDRVASVNFDVAAFTNLYRDHIGPGEHESFDHYLACKQRLFRAFSPKRIFYNADDQNALRVVQNPTVKMVSVSMEKDADYQGINLSFCKENNTLQVQFDMVERNCSVTCRLPFIGKENASNALLASAIASDAFGISLQRCAKSMENAKISGRSEIIPLPCGAIAVIDYAHNGESLERLLSSLRLYSPQKLVCLFGSVGERTKLRREELSGAALHYADFSVLTSDNPGTEPPELILKEMEIPFADHKNQYIIIPDRKEAIEYAVSILSSGDILVLAGKGHENYQLIGKEKIPFSEREILSSKINQFKQKSRLQ